MDLEKIILSKSDRKRQLYDISYIWNLKNNKMNLYTKQKQTSDTENKLMVIKGEREQG